MTLRMLATALLAGSTLLAAQGAHAAPKLEPGEVATAASASKPVSFSVILPLRDPAALDALVAAQQVKGGPSYHRWLTPQQFNARFGPTSASLAKVADAMRRAGFTVSEASGRSVRVEGTVGQVSTAFSTRVLQVQPRSGEARLVAETPLVLPAALKSEGAVIPAFADVPLFHPMVRRAIVRPENRTSTTGPYWFTDLKQAYSYPSYLTQVNGQTLDGTGITVAIVMSGNISDADLKNYLESEKFAARSRTRHDPTIAHVAIDGGGAFSTSDGGSEEASLDTQQVVGGAPGASVALLSMPSLSLPYVVDAYQYVLNRNTYDIVSSSFGGCESGFGSYVDTLHSLFLQGNVQGITFVASSGDSGAYCGGGSTTLGVENPASDPNVTAVGGGNLVTSSAGTLRSTYVRESAYADQLAAGGYFGAGGGISGHFAKPDYQNLLPVGSSKRTVPDIGMFVGGKSGGCVGACSADGSSVWIAFGTTGTFDASSSGYEPVIGTSVAAPEFAGALALYEQSAGRQGQLNAFLYTAAAAEKAGTGPVVLHHPLEGNDGYYTTNQPGVRYNYIYGVGTPIVKSLFGYGSAAAAGNPQTASNP